MKPTLAAGVAAVTKQAVDRARTIDFMGDKARVYATPMLVRDVEVACRELILAHLDPGEDSVGMRIELDHLAPTPMGMQAELTVRVTAVEGRQVTLEFEGRDDVEPICHGTHRRFVVDVAKTEARLTQKMQKAGIA
jgi:predicted thioesterase